MTRRLLAAASLAAVIGGFGVAALPAHADADDHGYICVGMNDKKKPGYMDGICLDQWIQTGGRG
jgi:hypothetical protein